MRELLVTREKTSISAVFCLKKRVSYIDYILMCGTKVLPRHKSGVHGSTEGVDTSI